MPLDCPLCGGEEEIFFFFANHSDQTVRISLAQCLCVGGHDMDSRPANEKEVAVTQSEYEDLKKLWAKPKKEENQSSLHGDPSDINRTAG